MKKLKLIASYVCLITCLSLQRNFGDFGEVYFPAYFSIKNVIK